MKERSKKNILYYMKESSNKIMLHESSNKIMLYERTNNII